MRVCLNPAAEPGNVPRGDDLQPWPLARFTRAGWLREACGIGDCHLQDWPDPESTIHLVRQAVRKWRTGICLGESCWKTLGPAQMLIMRPALASPPLGFPARQPAPPAASSRGPAQATATNCRVN